MPVSALELLCLWWSNDDDLLDTLSCFLLLFMLSFSINIAMPVSTLVLSCLWWPSYDYLTISGFALQHMHSFTTHNWADRHLKPHCHIYGKFIHAPVDCVEAVCNSVIRVMLCAGLSQPPVHIRGGGLPWGILVSTITEWVAVLVSVLFVFHFAWNASFYFVH